MPYVLGIDIGGSTTKAAWCRRAGRAADDPDWEPAEPVTLGGRSRTVPSALVMTPSGTVVPAEPGHRDQAVGGFLRRVGDDVPMVFGESRYPAHGMFAAMARWVVDRVWQQADAPPERIAVAHPTGWGPGRLRLLRVALDEADMPGTVLVTRARAVVESHQAAGLVPATGGALAVFRIGASSAEVSVVVPHGPGRFELLGCAELDEVGGFELDDVPSAQARGVLQAAVDLAAQVVSGCGVDPAGLAAVLIAGSPGAVQPIVSELLAAAFPVPILSERDPQMTVAAGAALAGRPHVRTAPATPPPPARPSTEIEPAPAVPPGWPEIDQVGHPTPERPPRPPVRVAGVKAGRQ